VATDTPDPRETEKAAGPRAKQLFPLADRWLHQTLAELTQPQPPATVSLPDGTRLRRLSLGVLECLPAQVSGSPLILSAGIHGNETAPIEILDDLVAELVTGQLTACRPCLFILGNPAAIAAQTRFTSINLNRLFTLAPTREDSDEHRRANQLKQAVLTFAQNRPENAGPIRHYDLHTAIRASLMERFAIFPFNPQEPERVPDQYSNRFLSAAAIEAVVMQNKAASTFSGFIAQTLGAQAFTLELGKVRPFGENPPAAFEAARRALASAISGQGMSESSHPVEFEVVHEILHTGEEFRFHVSDDTPNFTEYEPQALIWESAGAEYRVGLQPERIIFPNPAVPKGQRAGLMIRARTGRSSESSDLRDF